VTTPPGAHPAAPVAARLRRYGEASAPIRPISPSAEPRPLRGKQREARPALREPERGEGGTKRTPRHHRARADTIPAFPRYRGRHRRHAGPGSIGERPWPGGDNGRQRDGHSRTSAWRGSRWRPSRGAPYRRRGTADTNHRFSPELAQPSARGADRALGADLGFAPPPRQHQVGTTPPMTSGRADPEQRPLERVVTPIARSGLGRHDAEIVRPHSGDPWPREGWPPLRLGRSSARGAEPPGSC
jgi:hypothetical protein